ncbi:MAG: prepilin-type N-terminal cleavage/methylation domain-containing protein [Desulfobacteraceae bacterium]|nr:prepilin-type N-terminal cleavage/methylation domain-containing protein [Desulfobacteraceae bacterium]
MNYLSKNKESGFTLVELLIAMTIGLIILAALSSTFLIQRKTYDVQEQIVEMVQTARAAMDMITREIRMAGYDPTGAGFDGIIYNADQLQIETDINGDGNILNDDGSYDSNEHIVYKYYDKDSIYPYQTKRKTGNGNFQPFAENIQSFIFDYLDSSGSATTTTADIRQIRITITARTSKADADYSANNGYRTHTLTSFITPRNLGL